LKVISEGEVELWEAILTLVFFFILIILSYTADKINERKLKKEEEIRGQKPESVPERALEIEEAAMKFEAMDFYTVLIAE